MSTVLASPVSTRRVLWAWVELTKPTIVLLVVITGVPALLIAAGGFPAPQIFWGGLFGTVFAAGAAACFNMYFDRDIDALMKRTAGRPLPSGVLPPAAALALGFALAASSWATLVLCANWLAAVIAQASIAYYAIFYTVWLKRRTPQNIVIGGGAGASAPLIAWAAVTGTVTLPAVLLSSIVFLWTPAHFWALSLYRREDYARAGIPMLPVTHGEEETRRQIVIYTLITVPVTLLLQPLRMAGWIYTVPAAVMGAIFIGLSLRLRRSRDAKHAIGLFLFSILYLFVLYLSLTADALVAILRR
jgi:protoheme IX farnesyltransferase